MDKETLNQMNPGTLVEHLGIEITRFDKDKIEGTMPVDQRTIQPYGLLHGGATAALAETLGSYGSHLNVDADKFYTVGVEINCNHLRSARSGKVRAVAKCIHMGRKIHVWNTDVFNEEDKLIATSRLTVMVVPK